MKKPFLWFLTFSWAYLIFYLTSIPSPKVTDNEIIGYLLSGGEHFFFFGIQAVLLFLSLPKKIFNLSVNFVAVTLTSLFGLWDELHQLRIVGRTADPIDWVLDTFGAILFLVILNKVITKYKLMKS